MAHAEMMRRWAEKQGDAEFVSRSTPGSTLGPRPWKTICGRGATIASTTSRKRDATWTCCLFPSSMGNSTPVCDGLPGVLPEDHVQKVLELIRQGSTVSKLGIPPADLNADASAWQPDDLKKYLTGTYTFEEFATYFLAETFMYEGHKEFGLDLLHRCLELFSCKYGYTWDGANVFSHEGDTGERSYGTDYYQNLCLWAVPAALAGEDVSGPARPGGLVDRMIKAGAAH